VETAKTAEKTKHSLDLRELRGFFFVSSASLQACPRSGDVESIEVHDLVPRDDEVGHEFLLRVVAGVDL
jgi:hypothetical protein